jgi:AhpD family alkylhydroperoxidase
MVLDEKTRELIAVAASFTAHCEPCLTSHVKKAAAAGACEVAIREALEIAKEVRTGAASTLDRFATRWSSGDAPATTGFGCSRPAPGAGDCC